MTLTDYVLNGPKTVIQADSRDPAVSWQHHLDRTNGLRGGVDLVAAIGTPVLAPTDGVMHWRKADGTAGNSCRFAHTRNSGWADVFSHLSRYVGSDGAAFKKGQVIAYSGNTGGVAPHLHRHLLNPAGARVNPWTQFSGVVDYAYGLTAAAMLALQKLGHLKKTYPATSPEDGVFGELSVKSTQQILKDMGLLTASYKVDGIPGPLYGFALQDFGGLAGYYQAGGKRDGIPGNLTSKFVETQAIKLLGTIITPPTPTPEPGSYGIDIATSQAKLTIAGAKAQGIEFFIVKAGGLNVLPQYVAPEYQRQVDKVRAELAPLGHYYLIGKGKTPKQQADYFVENLYRFDVANDVLALDNEKLDANGDKWNDAQVAEFFARVMALTGIPATRCWHYAPATDFRAGAPWPLTETQGVRVWWAAYGANPTVLKPDHTPDLQGSVKDWDVHQFSSKFPIEGMSVDANYSRLPVAALFATGTVSPPIEPEPPTPPYDFKPLRDQLNAAQSALSAGIALLPPE